MKQRQQAWLRLRDAGRPLWGGDPEAEPCEDGAAPGQWALLEEKP